MNKPISQDIVVDNTMYDIKGSDSENENVEEATC